MKPSLTIQMALDSSTRIILTILFEESPFMSEVVHSVITAAPTLKCMSLVSASTFTSAGVSLKTGDAFLPWEADCNTSIVNDDTDLPSPVPPQSLSPNSSGHVSPRTTVPSAPGPGAGSVRHL